MTLAALLVALSLASAGEASWSPKDELRGLALARGDRAIGCPSWLGERSAQHRELLGSALCVRTNGSDETQRHYLQTLSARGWLTVGMLGNVVGLEKGGDCLAMSAWPLEPSGSPTKGAFYAFTRGEPSDCDQIRPRKP